MNHKLYYSLLGDYYSHAFIPNAKTNLVNDFTSNKILEHTQKINNSIDNKYLGVNNKYNLKVATATLDKNMNISLANVYGLPIDNDQYVVSYLSDSIIDTNQLNELMLQYKEEKILVYIVSQEKKHVNNIIDLIVEDIDLNIQNLIYKFILVSPLNYENVIKLISGLFDAPLSISNEIIINYTETQVYTNKHLYSIKHSNIHKYPLGHRLKPFEPVYLIGNIESTHFKNDRILNQLSVLSKHSFYEFYLNKILESIKATLIYVAIPIETAITNNSIHFIQNILSKIDIIKCTMYSFQREDNTYNTETSSKTMFQSNSMLSMKDALHINVLNYRHSDVYQTANKTFLEVTSSSKFNTATSKQFESVLIKNTVIKASSDNLMLDKKHDALNTLEAKNLSSFKTELALTKVKTEDKNIFQKEDLLKLGDKEKLTLDKKEEINTVETRELVIYGSSVDTLKIPSDKVVPNLVQNEPIHSTQVNTEIGYHSKSEKLPLSSKDKSIHETSSATKIKDKLQNKIFDNSKIKMYNLNEKNMRFQKSDSIALTDSTIVSKPVTDILKTLDELTVDTDTIIDK